MSGPRSAPRVRHSSARSCGRDSRWSPSFTRITSTSWLVTCSAMRSAISHGTSGSCWPCSRRTGQSIAIGPFSTRCVRPSSISARVIGIGLAVLARHMQDPIAHERGAFLEGHRLPHQRLGEVGRSGDADQRGDAVRAGAARRAARSSRPSRSRPGPASQPRSAGRSRPAHPRSSGRSCRPRTGRRWNHARSSRTEAWPGRVRRRTPPARSPCRRSCRCGSPAGRPRWGSGHPAVPRPVPRRRRGRAVRWFPCDQIPKNSQSKARVMSSR